MNSPIDTLDLFAGTGPLGKELRDQALAAHAANHSEDIHKVRFALLAACEMGGLTTLTGDDVMTVVERMQIRGDARWTACVLKGWDRVEPTDQFVPSRRKSRHHAPIRVWRLL